MCPQCLNCEEALAVASDPLQFVYKPSTTTWAVSKRSCSSEGDKDMLTRLLAFCLRHHSFGLRLREGFLWFCTYAELTLTSFCTHSASLRAAIFTSRLPWSLSLSSGIRCGRWKRGSRQRRWIRRLIKKAMQHKGWGLFQRIRSTRCQQSCHSRPWLVKKMARESMTPPTPKAVPTLMRIVYSSQTFRVICNNPDFPFGDYCIERGRQ